MGNIVNRVFDSSGPEGKVRGTPQQIIEKYLILARDAQLSNDRVSAENFMQHAEHYTRMLAEAQREMAAEQEQRRPSGEGGHAGGQGGYQQGGPGGYQQGGQGGYQQGGQGSGQQPRDNSYRDRPYREERAEPREEPAEAPVLRSGGLMDFIEELTDTGLVETPEARIRSEQPHPVRTDFADRKDRGPRDQTGERTERRRDERKPRAKGDEPTAAVTAESSAPVVSAPVVTAAPEQASPKRPRAPRKPRGDAPAAGGDGPAEAAE
jgi:hypothetical protein